jgi:zinc transporter ZupT
MNSPYFIFPQDAAVSLFLGILIHSILLSIAISLSALKAWQPPAKMSFNRAAIFLIILVLFRPAGILLGLALGTSSGYGGHFITAMLQSLSAGIFIHVTFFSLLPGEFGKPGESSCHVAGAAGNGASQPTLFWKLTLLVSGWTSLSIIMLLVKHSH